MEFIKNLVDFSIIVIALGVIFNFVHLFFKNKARKEYDRSISQIYLVEYLLVILESELNVYSSLKGPELTLNERNAAISKLQESDNSEEKINTLIKKMERTFYTVEQKNIVRVLYEHLKVAIKFHGFLKNEISKINSSEYQIRLLKACEERKLEVEVLSVKLKLFNTKLHFEKDLSELKTKESDIIDALFKTGLNK
jgi:hypothetical protein